MKNNPFYFVYWEDSYTHEPGWKEHEEFNDNDLSVPLVLSSGFLIAENNRSITLAQSNDLGSHSNNAISIPKSAILRKVKSRTNLMKHLKEVVSELSNENKDEN